MLKLIGMIKKLSTLVLTLALVLVASDGSALEVEINEKATVRGDVVHLGDVASFSPQTDSRVRELAGLELGAAPYPGQTLSLNARYLIFRLGHDIAQDKDIRVKVPQALLVSRTAQFVDPAQMQKIFKDHILKNAPWPPEEITFEAITTPSRLSLPEGRLSWEIREKNYDDYIGNVHLGLTFLVDGRPIHKASLSGKVRVRQKVLRAVRSLTHGEVIERGDIRLSDEEMSYMPRQTLVNADEIIGKRVVRSIRTDQVITAVMVEDPPLVKKGSRVLIKVESDLILITTIGRVLEEGRSGDLVRVENVSSGKEILATVRGAELVEVTF